MRIRKFNENIEEDEETKIFNSIKPLFIGLSDDNNSELKFFQYYRDNVFKIMIISEFNFKLDENLTDIKKLQSNIDNINLIQNTLINIKYSISQVLSEEDYTFNVKIRQYNNITAIDTCIITSLTTSNPNANPEKYKLNINNGHIQPLRVRGPS